MADPIGRVVAEIRAGFVADGGALVTVRGGRRFEGEGATAGDLPPFVLVRSLDRVQTPPRVAHARWRIAITSYENDPRLAMALDTRVSAILHANGPRHTPGAVAIYRSTEEIGGQPGEDPDTRWSSVTSIYIVHATTATNV